MKFLVYTPKLQRTPLFIQCQTSLTLVCIDLATVKNNAPFQERLTCTFIFLSLSPPPPPLQIPQLVLFVLHLSGLSKGTVSASCQRSKPTKCRSTSQQRLLLLCNSKPSQFHRCLQVNKRQRTILDGFHHYYFSFFPLLN